MGEQEREGCKCKHSTHILNSLKIKIKLLHLKKKQGKIELEMGNGLETFL